MAKKRKKKTTRRRHSMGAMSFSPNSPLVKYASMALGFLLGDQINTGIDGVVPANIKTKSMYDKGAAVGEAGIGAYLTFGKGKKSTIKTIAGGVLIGAGLKRGVNAFKKTATPTPPAVSGYGKVPVLSGYGKVPVLSGAGKGVGGYTPNSALNGYTSNVSLNGNKSSVMSGLGVYAGGCQ